MKIKMLRSAAGLDFSFAGDETPEVSEECGRGLIDGGLAELFEEEPSEVKEPAEDEEVQDRDALIAELTALGVVVRPNWKTETISLKIQEALAKKASLSNPWEKK